MCMLCDQGAQRFGAALVFGGQDYFCVHEIHVPEEMGRNIENTKQPVVLPVVE